MKFYIAVIFILIGSCLVLYLISQQRPLKNLDKYWGTQNLKICDYYFYFSKAAAYRSIFNFFTALSYFLRILGIISTFFLVYSILEDTEYSNWILVIAALCDGVSLLFPFQKYIDTFSFCSVKMEEVILKNQLENDEHIIKENFNNVYIECEKHIHLEQKI